MAAITQTLTTTLYFSFQSNINELKGIKHQYATADEAKRLILLEQIQYLASLPKRINDELPEIHQKYIGREINELPTEYTQFIDNLKKDPSTTFDSLLTKIEGVRKVIFRFHILSYVALNAEALISHSNLIKVNNSSSSSTTTVNVSSTSFSSVPTTSTPSTSLTTPTLHSSPFVQQPTFLQPFPKDTFYQPFFNFMKILDSLGDDSIIDKHLIQTEIPGIVLALPEYIKLCQEVLDSMKLLKKCRDLPVNISQYLPSLEEVLEKVINTSFLEVNIIDAIFQDLLKIQKIMLTPFIIE